MSSHQRKLLVLLFVFYSVFCFLMHLAGHVLEARNVLQSTTLLLLLVVESQWSTDWLRDNVGSIDPA
jgi:hypothetical protein